MSIENDLTRALLATESPFLHVTGWDIRELDHVRSHLWRARFRGDCVGVHLLRGARIATYRDLFREAESSWELPGYFGQNWAALEDCLWTFELQPARARVTFVTDSLSLLPDDDMSFAAFLSLLERIALRWREGDEPTLGGFPFHVVFQDADVPSLLNRIKQLGHNVSVSTLASASSTG